MKSLLSTFADIFDVNVMALFFIAAIFLLFLDCKSFKRQNLEKEYKLAKFFGYGYIATGIILYTLARFIRV